MLQYVDTARNFTFFYEGQSHIATRDHQHYVQIKAAVLADRDPEEILQLFDTKRFILSYSNGLVTIDAEDTVLIRGQKVSDYIVKKILKMHQEGESFDSLANFANRLLQNPNVEVREDLYKWLENGKLPLFEDGSFIAYKKVQADFYSHHTGKNGKVYHGIGERVSMPRAECDPSRYSTCSTGLHFCSYDYLSNFMGSSGKIIAVRIDPINVTAIPNDYNLTKGRCCEYDVLNELDPETVKFAFGQGEVYRYFNS